MDHRARQVQKLIERPCNLVQPKSQIAAYVENCSSRIIDGCQLKVMDGKLSGITRRMWQ